MMRRLRKQATSSTTKRPGARCAEGNDATLTDLVSKALTADAGDGAVQPPEAVEEAAPAEKPIADIGLAAFLEAVASATTPQPEAEDAKDEPSQGRSRRKS